jgi:hypothetical protein
MRLPRCVVCTAAGLVMALSALPAMAVNEPPRPPLSALNKIRDLTATVRARRTLQDDPALAKLNLGVEVNNGVATVWGPVPSLGVGHIAATKLEGLKGIDRVKSSFYIEERRDTALDLPLPDAAAAPERVEVAKPRDPAVKVGRATGEGPSLSAPRPTKTASPGEQAAQLQQSEPRFRGIGVEVKDGTVMVRRGSVAGRDVMDLVSKLRRIPGVRDVILTGDE